MEGQSYGLHCWGLHPHPKLHPASLGSNQLEALFAHALKTAIVQFQFCSNDATSNRDIILHYRDGGLRHISELHRGYDPLQYPLLFPNGTDGWHVYLKLQNGRKLTIMVRQNVSVLLRAKRLFQQYLVDVWASTQQCHH